MNDTEIHVVGNVVDSPRRVRLENGSVTNFRLASTARRFDRERQEFVDGNTLWIDVECWNDLGGHVSQTVSKGDPVIVVGELYTRHWETEHGRRSAPQIRASAVGPNLSRGTADFKRTVRAPAAAPPAEDVASPGFATASGDELADDRTGLDYEDVSETLRGVDTVDDLLAPGLR